jgi:hypothetical protein
MDRVRAIVLWLAAGAAMWTSAGCRASDAGCPPGAVNSAATQKPLVGAIRWDAWQHGPISNRYIEFLGPSQWRYRLPFYAVEVDHDTVSMAANTPAVMDAEIAYAAAAGLDFFGFNHYLTELRQSLDLYLASARKGEINFCLQMGSLNDERVADAVRLIATEATYQKVAGGRPLVFFQAWHFAEEAPPPSKADVDRFRAQVIQAGAQNPYIVVQDMSPRAAADAADRYGADAIGSYIMGTERGQPRGGQPFVSLARNAELDWNDYARTGKKVVPTVMTGWDLRPDPGQAGEPYWDQASPQEIATHLRDALTWNAANSCAAEVNTIQIFAWNEITEGGWLLPSNTAFNPAGGARLDAIAEVLR